MLLIINSSLAFYLWLMAWLKTKYKIVLVMYCSIPDFKIGSLYSCNTFSSDNSVNRNSSSVPLLILLINLLLMKYMFSNTLNESSFVYLTISSWKLMSLETLYIKFSSLIKSWSLSEYSTSLLSIKIKDFLNSDSKMTKKAWIDL